MYSIVIFHHTLLALSSSTWWLQWQKLYYNRDGPQAGSCQENGMPNGAAKQGDEKKSFLELLVEVHRKEKLKLRQMAELAPNVIAVVEADGEIGVYFDTSEWKATHPEYFDEFLAPKYLEGTGMQVLVLVSGYTFETAIEYAVAWAQQELQALKQGQLNNEPKLLEVPEEIRL